MIETQINDTFWLRSDERNFIIARKRITQNGENAGAENWENVGYYTSLPGLAKGLLDLDIRLSDANTFEELLCDYRATVSALQALYRELDQYKKLLLQEVQ